ncbi:hypothetical protein HYY69_01765 [Candidatus Woesearchaeota archaeon]|nr:hypothetical protein [Candidatus Woesearchaeota archaeon]
MARVTLGGLDIGNEILNTKLNIDTILTILLRKKIITQQEYKNIKKEIIDTYYSQYPTNE